MADLKDLGLKAWEVWERSRRQLWTVVISVVALGGLIYGVSLWRYWQIHVTTDNAHIQARVTPVSSRIPGTVIDVLVKDNQEVKAGEILLLLDPRDYSRGGLVFNFDNSEFQDQTLIARAKIAQKGKPDPEAPGAPQPGPIARPYLLTRVF